MSRHSDYIWPVSSDLKNATIAYKAYINGGSTDAFFEKEVFRYLHLHFKMNHEPLSKEEVTITEEELRNLGMESHEFQICMQTIANMLSSVVSVHMIRNDHLGNDDAFTITLSLL